MKLTGLRGCALRARVLLRRLLDTLAVRFVNGTYERHGSLRRLGQGGNPVGTLTPGTIGRIRADGMLIENAIETLAVPAGLVSPNDQTGWVPFGAAMTTRMREPARYTWPS